MVSRMNVEPRNALDISFELRHAAARRPALRFTGHPHGKDRGRDADRAAPGRGGQGLRRTIERRPKPSRDRKAYHPNRRSAWAASAARARAGAAPERPDEPFVAQRNEPVTISYEVPGIVLTIRGKAAESGAAGDIIACSTSNRTALFKPLSPDRAASP